MESDTEIHRWLGYCFSLQDSNSKQSLPPMRRASFHEPAFRLTHHPYLNTACKQTPKGSFKYAISSNWPIYNFSILVRIFRNRVTNGAVLPFMTRSRKPISDAEPHHVAVDETVIQLDYKRWGVRCCQPWSKRISLYRVFSTRITHFIVLFLHEL